MPRSLVLLLLAAPLLCAAPAVAQSIVIDNSDGAPEFVTTGNDWTSWGTLGHGFDGGDSDYLYLSHTVGGSDRRGMAIWTPTLPTAGRWQIATWYRRTSNRSSDADFVVDDGNGDSTRTTLNQRGSGASGWVDLGTYTCDAGNAGCRVTLDGTDDDQSDEANAVRFRYVGPGGGGGGGAPPAPESPEPVTDCSGFPGLGVHLFDGFATVVHASDFLDRSRATGLPDGRGAHSPNFDAGEHISARGWTLCDPLGDESIDRVEIAVRARAQYGASGRYGLIARVAAGGASSTWSGTDYRWRRVDVTGDRADWTWDDVANLVARMTLADHPGGRRDCDVWVDAFRVRVRYTSTAPPAMARDDAEGDGDLEPDECADGSYDDCDRAGDWWWDAGDGANADGLDPDDEEAGDPDPGDAPFSTDGDDYPDDHAVTESDAGDDGGATEDGTGGIAVGDGGGLTGDGCGAAGATLAWLLVLPLGMRRRT